MRAQKYAWSMKISYLMAKLSCLIYNKTESVSGWHQHDYYEFTIVLTGAIIKRLMVKKILLERGVILFYPIGLIIKVL